MRHVLARRVLLVTGLLGAAAMASAQPSASDWYAGTIVRIDHEAGKITLRHAGIRHLSLPAGDTIFRYTEGRWVNGRSAGESVRFRVDRVEMELRLMAMIFLPR